MTVCAFAVYFVTGLASVSEILNWWTDWNWIASGLTALSFQLLLRLLGHAVAQSVEALCYKPEGRWFEARRVCWIFWIYLILPAALGFRDHSASNRNEYQKQRKMFLGRNEGRRVRPISSSSSVNRLSRQCGILNISQLYRPPRPVTGIALLYGDGVCFLWGTNWTVSTASSSQYLAVNCEPIV
jgi:hypothetical protein